MAEKVFLKLDGIEGESRSERHFGEIEISSFYWSSRQPPVNDLTVIKQPDRTSTMLSVASAAGRSFKGLLTVEKFSFRGGLIRSMVFDLPSVFVDSVTSNAEREVITLNCRSVKMVRS